MRRIIDKPLAMFYVQPTRWRSRLRDCRTKGMTQFHKILPSEAQTKAQWLTCCPECRLSIHNFITVSNYYYHLP